MTGKNKVVIAAAGSGKTTHLVYEALKIAKENVLIATYTESNELEIKRKILETKGYMPSNIFVTTWFAFLIRHGIRPFQGGYFEFDVKGMQLVERQSGFRYQARRGPVYCGEADFVEYYFDKQHRVFSDKLSKLVIRCNEKSNGSVFDRLSRIYQHIFIDEVQDLAGYDLDILSCFFKSESNVLLVGDPRQLTYQTHHERRYDKYTGGKIIEFLKEKLPRRTTYEVDEETLNRSHRNSAEICVISSKLYPSLKAVEACDCKKCREPSPLGNGLLIVRSDKHQKYLETFKPMQLRLDVRTKRVHESYPALNFGVSKGLGFGHVIIHPTEGMIDWMKDTSSQLKEKTRAQFYVALTRARHSVAILHDFKDNEIMEGFSVYQ